MKRHLLIGYWLVVTAFVLTVPVYGAEGTFPDPNLEAAIRDALNKPEGPITDVCLLCASLVAALRQGF